MLCRVKVGRFDWKIQNFLIDAISLTFLPSLIYFCLSSLMIIIVNKFYYFFFFFLYFYFFFYCCLVVSMIVYSCLLKLKTVVLFNFLKNLFRVCVYGESINKKKKIILKVMHTDSLVRLFVWLCSPCIYREILAFVLCFVLRRATVNTDTKWPKFLL